MTHLSDLPERLGPEPKWPNTARIFRISNCASVHPLQRILANKKYALREEGLTVFYDLNLKFKAESNWFQFSQQFVEPIFKWVPPLQVNLWPVGDLLLRFWVAKERSKYFGSLKIKEPKQSWTSKVYKNHIARFMVLALQRLTRNSQSSSRRRLTPKVWHSASRPELMQFWWPLGDGPSVMSLSGA